MFLFNGGLFYSQLVGLATVIGAGLPLGKEGPVMHMASIVSTMLMNLLKAIKGVVDNEAHSTDLLAAASTMGVAVCYAAPIGGELSFRFSLWFYFYFYLFGSIIQLLDATQKL